MLFVFEGDAQQVQKAQTMFMIAKKKFDIVIQFGYTFYANAYGTAQNISSGFGQIY